MNDEQPNPHRRQANGSPRKNWVTLRVTDEERAEIKRRAALNHQPASTYIRSTAYRGWARAPLSLVKKLIFATRKIDDLIAEIRAQSSPELSAKLDELRAENQAIRAEIPNL